MAMKDLAAAERAVMDQMMAEVKEEYRVLVATVKIGTLDVGRDQALADTIVLVQELYPSYDQLLSLVLAALSISTEEGDLPDGNDAG